MTEWQETKNRTTKERIMERKKDNRNSEERKRKWTDGRTYETSLLVADSWTRDSTLCLVGWSVHWSHFWIATGFCITAPAQLSATVLPCIRPCLLSRESAASATGTIYCSNTQLFELPSLSWTWNEVKCWQEDGAHCYQSKETLGPNNLQSYLLDWSLCATFLYI